MADAIQADTQVGAAPFVEVPGAGTYQVNIVDADVPVDWTTDPNAGLIADPTSIYDMQIQVAADQATAVTSAHSRVVA